MQPTPTPAVAVADIFRVTRRALLEVPAVLAIAVVVALRSLAQEDLSFWDETAYLERGLLSRQGAWPSFTSGATYSDLYALLSRFFNDPIDLYFAGRALAAVSLVAGVWLAARLLTDPYSAWGAAAITAVTPAPYVWPGVAGPATALVLISIALVLRFSRPWSLGVASGLLWIAAGSRPEMTWLAVASSAASIIWLAIIFIRSRPVNMKLLGTALAVVTGGIVTPIILTRLHGSPFNSYGRDWVAFGQHFSLRHARPAEDPWMDWVKIVDRNFPGADSTVSAFRTNPSMAMRHVGANIFDTPEVFARFFSQTWKSGWFGKIPFGALMVLILVLGMVISLLAKPKLITLQLAKLRKQLFSRDRAIPNLFVLLSLIFLLIPLIVVYPREHYLLAFVGLAIIVLVLTQRAVANDGWLRSVPMFAILALFGLFALNTTETAVSRMSNPPSLATNAKELNLLGGEWRLLGVDWGLEVYIKGLTQLDNAPLQPGENFRTYLDRNRINLILYNDRFISAPWVQADGFIAFMFAPERFGFERMSPRSPLWIRST